jgi:hypothetical protein
MFLQLFDIILTINYIAMKDKLFCKERATLVKKYSIMGKVIAVDRDGERLVLNKPTASSGGPGKVLPFRRERK